MPMNIEISRNRPINKHWAVCQLSLPPVLAEIHCKKKVSGFSVPSRDAPTKLSLDRNNQFIPVQGEYC
jgi:hypothetical protein